MLEHGEIVERGTHDELLALGGRYRQLYDKQYRFEKDRFINPGEDFTPEPEAVAMRTPPGRTTRSDRRREHAYRLVAERHVSDRLMQANAVWPGSGQPLDALRERAARASPPARGGRRYARRRPAATTSTRRPTSALQGHRRQRMVLVLLFVILALALTTLARL